MFNNKNILAEILGVYKKCDVKYFPIDCFYLLRQYGYKIYSYGELNKKNPLLLELCGGYSDESFREGNTKTIAYNERMPDKRVRFSLMHELGHIILDHKGESEIYEQEANYFASNILAPRMAIHYSECKNTQDVSHIFDISLQAADIAFNDYRRWRRFITYNKFTTQDKSMYQHFYNEYEDKFVWDIKTCRNCGREISDRKHDKCLPCRFNEITIHEEFFRQIQDAIDRNEELHFRNSAL